MLELVEPGLTTLVQGVPFRGLRHLGMPLAGAADPVALTLANWLVGNAAEDAALETAYAPLSLVVKADCVVAVQGAATETEIDGRIISVSSAFRLAKGSHLRIPSVKGGCRSYLAVRGGIGIEPVLSATSTFTPAKLGGLGGQALPKGAILNICPPAESPLRELPEQYRLRHGMDFLFRVTEAPEYQWIEPGALAGKSWTTSRRADRIGLELEGTPIRQLRTDQLDSSAVFPGTIQCPPSGLPFLLGPDAQTTGGYPRIARVIRADRHLIGQLRPGARVRFRHVKPAEAQSLYRSKIALIRRLQPDFRLD